MATLRRLPSCIRRPTAAGYFYPAEADALGEGIDALTQTDAPPGPARAVIVPHGSYRHCGVVTGAVFARTSIPRRCIILGPSHTGSWMPWSVMERGAYRTPLGEVPVDEACAEALRSRCSFLEADAWAQRGEHAVEVLLPFLQRLGPPDLSIVPIIMGSDDRGEFERLSRALAQVIRMQEERVLLIASSDLSHYEPQARGAQQDGQLLEAMRAMDSGELVRLVQEGSVLMCGYGAVVCALEAAKTLGAREAALVRYATSAEAGGDPHSVIGYAGVVVN